MARVLCAWEFGGDLGHVRRLIPIARELRAMGHEVTTAFRDSTFAEYANSEGFETFITPLLRMQPQVNPSPLNFSDVLLNLGFQDVNSLSGALVAWGCLFDLLAPDVLVADYAPTAMVTARLRSMRSVTIGTGFSVPPMRDPIPALRPWIASDPGVLRALDARLLECVRKAAGQHASQLPARAFELFKPDANLLCTFAEIDPFAPREGAEYVGPQGDATTGVAVQWKTQSGPRVFAYLKPRNPRFDAVLAGLASLAAEVIVAAPGLAPDRAKAASTASMRVVPAAVNLELLLPQASLCVFHAGPGVAARAMAAGVPMALLPLQLEQFLIAKRIEKSGVAVISNPEEPAPDFRQWLSPLLAGTSYHEAAARLAQSFRGHSFGDSTTRSARRIAEIATG